MTGHKGLMASLSGLQELISERPLLYWCRCSDNENVPTATLYFIDAQMNRIYYMDYHF